MVGYSLRTRERRSTAADWDTRGSARSVVHDDYIDGITPSYERTDTLDDAKHHQLAFHSIVHFLICVFHSDLLVVTVCGVS